MGCWDVGCTGCWDAGCGMHGMLGCGMRDVGCGMCGMRDAGCMGCCGSSGNRVCHGFQTPQKMRLEIIPCAAVPFPPLMLPLTHSSLSCVPSPAAYSSPCSVARLAPHLTATGPSHTMMPRMHAPCCPHPSERISHPPHT